MPIPPKQSVAHYRGDSLGIRINCWQDTDKTIPAVFTGSTITSQIRVKADETIPPLDTFAVNVASNVVTLSLTPAKVTALPDATVWDVQVDWFSNGTSVQTIAQGTLTLTQDVTHA